MICRPMATAIVKPSFRRRFNFQVMGMCVAIIEPKAIIIKNAAAPWICKIGYCQGCFSGPKSPGTVIQRLRIKKIIPVVQLAARTENKPLR